MRKIPKKNVIFRFLCRKKRKITVIFRSNNRYLRRKDEKKRYFPSFFYTNSLQQKRAYDCLQQESAHFSVH